MDSFIGEVRIFAFNYAPVDWAYCNGSLASIQQYTALYGVVGTRYGGDGRTTFGLPNMMGYAPIGAGVGTGLTPRLMGQTYGSETSVLTQLPSHDHTLTLKATATNFTTLTATPAAGDSTLTRILRPLTATTATSVLEFAPAPPSDPVALSSATCGSVGGGKAHENRQPYLAMNFCVALSGVFPVRP